VTGHCAVPNTNSEEDLKLFRLQQHTLEMQKANASDSTETVDLYENIVMPVEIKQFGYENQHLE